MDVTTKISDPGTSFLSELSSAKQAEKYILNDYFLSVVKTQGNYADAAKAEDTDTL